jgi:hypothetical protein
LIDRREKKMATAAGLIQVGETVVLQRYNYMRTHVLNPTKESGPTFSIYFFQLLEILIGIFS